MLELILDSGRRRTLRVLCVGAHCDDIEIGCGATLRVLQARGQKPVIDWVVLSGTEERRRRDPARDAHAGAPRLSWRTAVRRLSGRPVSRGPTSEIKNFCESLKRRPDPDLILCHERDDRHQDHRVVNEMIWNTFRRNVVLEYEIPKWDGGLGQPNVYVPVSAKDAGAKVDALLKSYRSQAGRDWFTRETFMAMLRLRGLECRSPSGYAEAFHGRKLVFKGC